MKWQSTASGLFDTSAVSFTTVPEPSQVGGWCGAVYTVCEGTPSKGITKSQLKDLITPKWLVYIAAVCEYDSIKVQIC